MCLQNKKPFWSLLLKGFLSVVCLALTACVSGSKNITSSYISPLQYSAYDVADCFKLNQKQKSCATI